MTGGRKHRNIKLARTSRIKLLLPTRLPLGILPLFSNFQFPVSGFEFLAQRAPQALGGRLQLALQSIHLLRDVRQLFFGELSRLNNLMSLTIRPAHRCAYSLCYSRQPALFGH
jgi:hypothetical protein